MRISVIGTGYLGTTHAACLAELGFEVLGVDSDLNRLASLAAGRLPFREAGLDALLADHVGRGTLRFSASIGDAARFADVHFVCVGTPQRLTGPEADVSAVVSVTEQLAEAAEADCLIVGKSTVPVGVASRLQQLVDRVSRPGVTVTIAWNPEFLREGHAVADTLAPERLVLGVTDAASESVLRHIYARPIADGAPVHVTDPGTAELAKHAANSFLATKLSFVNAMAEVCERAGADVTALADILGGDGRIGRPFLDAGVGFGGGCLPKDLRALSARATELGATSAARLLDEVDTLNLVSRRRTVDLAVSVCGPARRGQRVTVLGAAFKPHSDDVRDSPALAVAEALRLHGFEVRVHDPEALENARKACPWLSYVDALDPALAGTDLVLLLTEWPDYLRLDPAETVSWVRTARLVDGRNKLDHDHWRDAGWRVWGLGRAAGQPVTPSPPRGGRSRRSLRGRARSGVRS